MFILTLEIRNKNLCHRKPNSTDGSSSLGDSRNTRTLRQNERLDN